MFRCTTLDSSGERGAVQNIFEEGELRVESVVMDFFTTAADGKSDKVAHFDRDVRILLEYRETSLRGTPSRIRVTHHLLD